MLVIVDNLIFMHLKKILKIWQTVLKLVGKQFMQNLFPNFNIRKIFSNFKCMYKIRNKITLMSY